MPKKPVSIADISKIVEKQKDFTIDKLRKSLEKRTGHLFTLEQKVMVLRLLQLNDMDYTTTAKECKVSNQVIYKWKHAIGQAVFDAIPTDAITKITTDLEMDLAKIKNIALAKAYRTISNNLDKLDELSQKATSTRQIYAVAESMNAAVELIKAEKDITVMQPPVNDFYFQIHQLMINNTRPDNGNKG